MPKVRQLDPEFWDDPDIAKLTRDERLLTIAMITLLADDEGRFLADPVVIRKKVFGYDKVSIETVDKWLRNISAKCRNFQSYVVGGQRYMVLLNFAKKQGIRYVVHSKLPSPVSALESVTAEICGNLPEVPEDSCRVEKSRVEKSRVEPPCSPPVGGTPARQSKTPVSEDWKPSDTLLQWASMKYPLVDVAEETERFIRHHISKGTKFANIGMAWQNWISGKFIGRVPVKRDSGLTVGRNIVQPTSDEFAEDERLFERWRRGGIWVAEHGRDEAEFNRHFAGRKDFAIPMTFNEWCLLEGERPWEQHGQEESN